MNEAGRDSVVQVPPPDKNRPVLILSRDQVIEYLGEVTIAPVTTTIHRILIETMEKEDPAFIEPLQLMIQG